MDAQLAQNKIKLALKQLLKKQNHTYADVAKVWACSLPTVKRQLGPEELPLSRLLILLEWLNLSLTDLQKLAESDSLEAPKFTAKQSDYLAKNPREFSFLMKLYEELTPDQIAKKYKLTAATLAKILLQLEKHDLIRVGAGGKVKPVYEQTPGVDGPLAQVHMRRIIDRGAQFQKNYISEMLDKKARGLETGKGSLIWHCGNLTPKSYEHYAKKFQELMNEVTELSKIEDKSFKVTEMKTAVFNSSFFFCEREDRNLRLVTEYFDEGLSPSES